MLHPARLDAGTECVVKTMHTDVERGGQRQTLFTTLYERSLRRAVAAILKMAWKTSKNVYTATLDNDGMGSEK